MRDYLRSLTLAEDFVAIASQATVVVLNANLLVLLIFAQSIGFEAGTPRRQLQDRVRRLLTPTTAVYLGVSIYGGVTMMGLVVYEFVNYNYDEPNPPHDFYLFFWLGSFSLNYVAISSVIVFFLALERCLTLTHDSWHVDETRNGRLHARFAIAGACATFFIYAACAITLLVELPLQEDKIGHCVTFTCTLIRLRSLPHVITKTSFACLNLMMAVIFYRLVRHCSSFKNLNNFVIGLILALEVVLSTVPNCTFFVLNLATGEPSGNFVGPLMTTCVALENALVTVCYTYLMIARPDDTPAIEPASP